MPIKNSLPPSSSTITRIVDRNNNVIVEIGYKSGWIKDPSGNQHLINEATAIQLMDGSSWMPIHIQHGSVYVGVCLTCRETHYAHGLVRLSKAHSCTCGRLVCPIHAKLCSDGVYRCPECRGSFNIKSFFKKLFFKEVSE